MQKLVQKRAKVYLLTPAQVLAEMALPIFTKFGAFFWNLQGHMLIIQPIFCWYTICYTMGCKLGTKVAPIFVVKHKVDRGLVGAEASYQYSDVRQDYKWRWSSP